MMSNRKNVRNRRGVGLVYTTVMLTVLMLVSSLAVDVARVQIAKSELRRAVDASARFGAMGLDIDTTTAYSNIATAGAENPVDNKPLVYLNNEDIFLGTWDTTTRKFTVLNGSAQANANAVQVFGRRIAKRGTGIPLTFAAFIGQPTCNLNGLEAIAMVTKSINVNQNVPATANPFLSGMPYGSEASNVNPHNSPDFAGNSTDPRQSPLQVSLAITTGQAYTFDSIDGDARHDPNLNYYSPDGDLSDIGHNVLSKDGSAAYGDKLYPQNGMSDLIAPINALIGVYLDDNAPNTTPAPTLSSDDLKKAPQDFSDASNRNMTIYQPKLKQIFFIGDGKTDDGTIQQFVAPKGATRLFLATWDFYEWNNNAGSRNIRVVRPAVIALVK